MAGRRINPVGLISAGVIALVLTVNAVASGLAGPDADDRGLISAEHLSAQAAQLARAAVHLSPGCKDTPGRVRSGTTRLYIESGERIRSYLLSIPTTYRSDRASSMIISFHGRNRSGAVSQQTTGLSQTPAIVAYPDGAANRTGKSDWEGAPLAAPDVDDVAFTTAVMDRVESTLCVDLDRVYTVGHSDGGGFAVAAACELRQRVAAVVVASAAFYDKVTACASPISILEMHAAGDRIIPYRGRMWHGFRLASITSLLKAQADVNGCARGPSSYSIRGRAIGYRWPRCESGRAVQHIRVTSKHHGVPTTADLGGESFAGLAWTFLQDHPRPPVDLTMEAQPRSVRS